MPGAKLPDIETFKQGARKGGGLNGPTRPARTIPPCENCVSLFFSLLWPHVARMPVAFNSGDAPVGGGKTKLYIKKNQEIIGHLFRLTTLDSGGALALYQLARLFSRLERRCFPKKKRACKGKRQKGAAGSPLLGDSRHILEFGGGNDCAETDSNRTRERHRRRPAPLFPPTSCAHPPPPGSPASAYPPDFPPSNTRFDAWKRGDPESTCFSA